MPRGSKFNRGRTGLHDALTCRIIDADMPFTAARAAPRSATVAIVVLFGLASAPASLDAAPGQLQEPARRTAELEEYSALFVSLAQQALAAPRLAAPMPCLPHWLAANDHVVVAVSSAGAGAGLERGDTLERIGDTELTGRADGVWDAAMRSMKAGPASYAVAVARNGATVRLILPCRSELARELHRAERSMWTAIARRDWNGCLQGGDDMIRAFGVAFSPPLMIMARCASAKSGEPDAVLTSRLGHALLQEMAAHPNPSADVREQLFLTLRDLEAIARAGGPDYAMPLRAAMAELGVEPPAFTAGEPNGSGR